MKIEPKGAQASALKKRKQKLLDRARIPSEGLSGSLSLTHRRCGKKSCHCAGGKGHPVWSLTFMDSGKKRVERIPDEWVKVVEQRVKEGKEFKEAIVEIFNSNAELLVLLRKQESR